MAGYIKYEKQEDGTIKRVAGSIQDIIAEKEAQLITIYNEIQKLKEE